MVEQTTFSRCYFSRQILSFVAKVAILSFYLILFGSFDFLRMLETWESLWTFETKFYLGLDHSKGIFFIPLTSPPQKRNGRKFCVEVFWQGMEEQQTKIYLRMVKTISLGIPRHPTGPITLSVCTPLNFVFWATYDFRKNLERLYLVLVFSFVYNLADE